MQRSMHWRCTGWGNWSSIPTAVKQVSYGFAAAYSYHKVYYAVVFSNLVMQLLTTLGSRERGAEKKLLLNK